jgi:hypothetical protein
MKESEFIELLNLYLDHELSAADASRLEAEVQNNPARRKVYQQYCRMQKACKLLATDFQTDTADAAAADERKIIAFNPAAAAAIAAQRKRTSALLTFGGLAAAACLAVIFANRSQQSGTTTRNQGQNVVQVAPTPSAPNVELVRVVGEPAGRRMLGGPRQPKLVSDPLLLTSSTQEVVMANAVSEANEQLKWLTSLEVTPIQPNVPAEQLRFDVRPATLRPEARVLGGNRAPAEANVEMTAFRFVK